MVSFFMALTIFQSFHIILYNDKFNYSIGQANFSSSLTIQRITKINFYYIDLPSKKV